MEEKSLVKNPEEWNTVFFDSGVITDLIEVNKQTQHRNLIERRLFSYYLITYLSVELKRRQKKNETRKRKLSELNCYVSAVTMLEVFDWMGESNLERQRTLVKALRTHNTYIVDYTDGIAARHQQMIEQFPGRLNFKDNLNQLALEQGASYLTQSSRPQRIDYLTNDMMILATAKYHKADVILTNEKRTKHFATMANKWGIFCVSTHPADFDECFKGSTSLFSDEISKVILPNDFDEQVDKLLLKDEDTTKLN